MNQSKTNATSDFGKACAALDADFDEIVELSGQIGRASLDSERDLDRAQELLVKFTECGNRISESLPAMAQALNDTRARAEEAANVVAQRAVAIQERKQVRDLMLERLQILGEMVKNVSEGTVKLSQSSSTLSTADGKAALAIHIPEIIRQLDTLSEAANSLKSDAQGASFKTLERSADSLSQKLKSVRNTLGKLSDLPESPLHH